MQKKRLAAVAAIVTAGLAMSGASAQPAPSADVSTAIEELIATGDVPADVTGEEGVWNFAGPASACPGLGWNCVTLGADPIVQRGTVNVAQCVGADCVGITQVGDVNKIECGPGGDPDVAEEKEAPVAVQGCGPSTQTGDHNIAIFRLVYDVDVGSTQCVLQKGEIEQDGVTNQFKAQFIAKMTTTTGLMQTQDARQRLVVDQIADEKNESEIEEVQIQYATGNATVQNQNTGCTVSLPGMPTPVAGDCNPDGGPTTPVACLDLRQQVDAGGDNSSKFKQEVNQDAQTTALVATETQGAATGGNDAAVHQEIVPEGDLSLQQLLSPDAGKNLGLADQYTYQTLPDRAGLEQSQVEDPFCCGGSQFGGEDDEETINQWVQQEGNADAVQVAEATAVSVSENGECTATQNLENNSADAQTSQTADPPCAIAGTTTCTSSGEGGGCSSSNCSPGFFNQDSGRCEDEPTETITLSSGARPAGAGRS